MALPIQSLGGPSTEWGLMAEEPATENRSPGRRTSVQSTSKNEQGMSGQRNVSGLAGPSTYSGCWFANSSTRSCSADPSNTAPDVVVRIRGRKAYSCRESPACSDHIDDGRCSEHRRDGDSHLIVSAIQTYMTCRRMDPLRCREEARVVEHPSVTCHESHVVEKSRLSANLPPSGTNFRPFASRNFDHYRHPEVRVRHAGSARPYWPIAAFLPGECRSRWRNSRVTGSFCAGSTERCVL